MYVYCVYVNIAIFLFYDRKINIFMYYVRLIEVYIENIVISGRVIEMDGTSSELLSSMLNAW